MTQPEHSLQCRTHTPDKRQSPAEGAFERRSSVQTKAEALAWRFAAQDLRFNIAGSFGFWVWVLRLGVTIF